MLNHLDWFERQFYWKTPSLMVKGHWFCVDFLSIPPPKKQLMSSGRAFLVTPPNHWVQAKSREIADGEELTVRKWYPLVIYYSLLLKIAIEI